MLFFIAFEEWGFIMNFKGATTRNIRNALPFNDWYKADKFAREQGKGKPYAILSNTSNVVQTLES